MRLSQKLWGARWLLGIPVAWATSALVVLGDDFLGADLAASLQGPAHFHVGEPSAGRHSHQRIERHHHADGGAAEIRVDPDRHALNGTSKPLTLSLDTLPAATLAISPRTGARAAETGGASRRASHFPSPLERPPAAL
jgi:hypothetical protein